MNLKDTALSVVIAGLDPAIHERVHQMQIVHQGSSHDLMDARVKPAHDVERAEKPTQK
jgi:hypothetical protein